MRARSENETRLAGAFGKKKGRSNQIGNSWVMQEDVGEIDPGLCFWDWTRGNDSTPAVGGSSSGEARGKVSLKSQQ